ncbi:hypothetical protein OCU04_003068 [Sclerotinia nivalis]|uniref:Uncharacterized protein n=1 Tax=Sclerotinia nivalis TaxID=352851 RepID=A0A9X0AVD6_9HELO|nr:hypothetical protein OCU04_003068 [Sclerotinia nivalis]
MCFANRSFCKGCRKETIKYVSKCDQYPEVTTETTTHAIRGRHRRIRACKDCKRKETQRAEEESRNIAVHHGQAKAILEWMRLERPLPLTDEVIADKYSKLFHDRERLHPYCVGFTNMHEGLIAERKEYLATRADQIAKEYLKVKGVLSKEAEGAVLMIVNEEKMMDEAFKRQAEIDSGVRTMTESDKGFSLHEIGKAESYQHAMDLIMDAQETVAQETVGPKFAEWAGNIPDQFITEDRVRREINGFLDVLVLEGSDETIDEFRGEVIRLNVLDEETFDFDPNARVLQGDTPAWIAVNMPERITFREWVDECENTLGRIRPLFQRWYRLIDDYRAYLAQIASAQHTLFNVTRNTIAARTFRALTGRPETRPRAPSINSPPRYGIIWVLEGSETEGSDDSLDDELSGADIRITPIRERLEESIAGLESLLYISNTLMRNLPDLFFRSVTASLIPPIRLLNRQIESNTWPTEDEWRMIQRNTESALEALGELNAELNVRVRRALEEELERERERERQGRNEPEPGIEPFFFDLTPMQVVALEREPENIAYARRAIIGLSPPPQEFDWQEEDGDVWNVRSMIKNHEI